MTFWELIKITLINGAIGSFGASTALFLYYAVREGFIRW
jgi:hypothetical protein